MLNLIVANRIFPASLERRGLFDPVPDDLDSEPESLLRTGDDEEYLPVLNVPPSGKPLSMAGLPLSTCDAPALGLGSRNIPSPPLSTSAGQFLQINNKRKRTQVDRNVGDHHFETHQDTTTATQVKHPEPSSSSEVIVIDDDADEDDIDADNTNAMASSIFKQEQTSTFVEQHSSSEPFIKSERSGSVHNDNIQVTSSGPVPGTHTNGVDAGRKAARDGEIVLLKLRLAEARAEKKEASAEKKEASAEKREAALERELAEAELRAKAR